jgi:hypothetical protein
VNSTDSTLIFEKLPVAQIVKILPSVHDICAFIVTSCNQLSESTLHYPHLDCLNKSHFNIIHILPIALFLSRLLTKAVCTVYISPVRAAETRPLLYSAHEPSISIEWRHSCLPKINRAPLMIWEHLAEVLYQLRVQSRFEPRILRLFILAVRYINLPTAWTKHCTAICVPCSRISARTHVAIKGSQTSPACPSERSSIEMIMSVEHLRSDTDRGQLKCSEHCLSLWHFIHQKFQKNWPENWTCSSTVRGQQVWISWFKLYL